MLEVRSKTDIGRTRSANEDSLLVKNLGSVYLLAVADGLGGHASGEVASKIALVEIEEYVKPRLGGAVGPAEALREAISKANTEIRLLSRENPDYAGMGTTLVLAILSEGKALVANVGDSRAYLVGDRIEKITRDHSLVQELLDKKIITVEEAFGHPQKNIVTRALGIDEEVKPDFKEVGLDDNILLLCSDGLTDSLRDGEIREIVVASKDLGEACTRLVEQAKEKGGEDNITVILAKWGDR